MGNDAMTGHDDGNRIRPEGHTHSSGILFPSYAHGDPLIGSHAAVGNPRNRLPHLTLKRGACRPINGQSKVSTLAIEIGQELDLRVFHDGRSGIVFLWTMMGGANRWRQVNRRDSRGRSRNGHPTPRRFECACLRHIMLPRIFARRGRVCASPILRPHPARPIPT